MHARSTVSCRNVQTRACALLVGRSAQPAATPSVVCACQRDEHSANAAGAMTQAGPPEPIVQYQPKARKVSALPQNVPVVHSSAYLLRRSEPKDGGRPATSSREQPTSAAEQNAVEWALRQADAYFDRVEADSEKQSAARSLVKNPATQATMKTMQGVTTLGAATAPELAKAAMPVGKKLLSVSADMLVAGVGALNEAAKKNKERKKPE